MKVYKFTLLLILSSVLFFSCKKRGCADPEALNFDSEATKDDHSCYYFWVGQSYGGGRVFYIDQTGKHGLIAAEFDLPNTQWGYAGINITGSDATIVGSGLQNTLDNVAAGSEITAASICNDLDTLGFSDWYLPSIEELKGLSTTLGKIGQANLTSGYYWSSSEGDEGNAWVVLFANDAVLTTGKGAGYSVRAVRSF